MKKILLSFLIISLLITFINPRIALAATAINLDINPVAVGENFSIHIKAQSVDTSFYYSEFALSYDISALNFLSASTSAGSLAGGCASGTIAYSDRGETDGTVWVQIFRTGCDPLVITDETSLVILNFQAVATGDYNFTFSDTLFQDSEDNPASDITWNSGQITINNETNPPVRSNGLPAGSLAMNTTSATLRLNTNEIATCRYDIYPDIDYDSMSNTFSNTNSTTHSTLINGLTNGQSYDYYVKCKDVSNNKNENDLTISFNVVDTAMVALSPTNSNIILGNPYSITLSVPSVTNLGAIVTNITYDNTKLEYSSVEFSDAIINCPESIYTEDSSISGIVNIYSDCFGSPLTGDIAIATLHFNTIALAVNSTLSPTEIILWDGEMNDIPYSIQNAVVNINLTPDTIAPAAINNFTAATSTTNSVTLTWTAPGDDNNSGTAVSYDIRYSLANITLANWNSATQAVGEPTPHIAGTSETFTISGLNANTTYYFAIRTRDEVPNISGLSNITSRATLSQPDITLPTISILTPTTNSTYATSTSPMSLSGTASDNIGVSQVTWSSNRGSSGTANGTSTWSISGSNVALLSGQNIITVTASDIAGNTRTDTITVTLTPADIVAPVRSNGSPSGALAANTTQTTLSLTTDELAICRYSMTAGVSFSSMTNIISSASSTNHSVIINGLTNGGSYNYNIKCQDIFSNSNLDDYAISFSVSNQSSGGGGGGGGGGNSTPTPVTPPVVNEYNFQPTSYTVTRTDTNVILNWVNPTDTNFNKIIIIRTTDAISDYMTYEAISGIGLKIYEGTAQTFTDNSIASNITYYYAIFSVDKSGKYSKSIVKQAIATVKETKPVENNQNNKTYTNLGGVSSQIVEEVSQNEAEQIYSFNKYVSFNDTTRKLYTYIIGKSSNKLDEQDKFAIAYYIHNGTPTTIILGAGERTGVLNSYLSAFNKLPTNSDEWQDIIKIANGRWPEERNVKAENKAQNTLFIQVYKRQPKMDNAKDNAAVTVITYGLRPAIRNMNSEKAAIKIFKAIFKDNPIDAVDWDIVRAIAYSGATR